MRQIESLTELYAYAEQHHFLIEEKYKAYIESCKLKYILADSKSISVSIEDELEDGIGSNSCIIFNKKNTSPIFSDIVTYFLGTKGRERKIHVLASLKQKRRKLLEDHTDEQIG